MTAYERITQELQAKSCTWVVTGCAGFIGSHLTETLLQLGQRVIGLDDFSTGTRENLNDVRQSIAPSAWNQFEIVEGSISDGEICKRVCHGADFVLHEAAFVSVPLSVTDPITCNNVNVVGFLNMLLAAREAGVKSFVYASSSAVYGDTPKLPKVETDDCKPISPYGVSKLVDELYADAISHATQLSCTGLRYFNVFGGRQNPAGGYAAVIPKWVSALVCDAPCVVFGNGSATRDFCHIENVVQANVLAATKNSPGHTVFNVALGEQVNLNQLYRAISQQLEILTGKNLPDSPRYDPPRAGDILHSGADISKIQRVLGFEPTIDLEEGLKHTVRWYAAHLEDERVRK
jgi:UDP-N-acetylglucosamine/UDP-N-acetylgalactosamine 4-epimerase